MSRIWWVIFGALGGACIIGSLGVLVRAASDPESWNLFTLFLSPVVGLVVGGLLGSRAPRMDRGARVAFGALLGAALLAVVGGFAFLFLGGPGDGLARYEGKNFVIGAAVGGLAGIFIGGAIGARAGRPDQGETQTQ